MYKKKFRMANKKNRMKYSQFTNLKRF